MPRDHTLNIIGTLILSRLSQVYIHLCLYLQRHNVLVVSRYCVLVRWGLSCRGEMNNVREDHPQIPIEKERHATENMKKNHCLLKIDEHFEAARRRK